jgi:L-malate glycosyltransferase
MPKTSKSCETRPGVCIFQRFMPPDASGAGKQALAIAHVVRDAGWDVVLLTDGDPGTDPACLEGFPVESVTPPPFDPTYPQILAYWLRLARALHRLKSRFDVLHVHAADFMYVGVTPIARLLGKRIVVRSSMAGEFSLLSRSKSGRLQKSMLRFADAFVVLSQRLVAEYIDSGLPPSKLNLIPNGVDTTVYHPVSAEEQLALRRQLELPIKAKILVFHGVFVERKFLHWLVDVLAPRLEQLDLTLLLVGGPAREEPATEYAARLRRQISDRDSSRIIVRDFGPGVHGYLQAADAYVLPSTNEGLSNALLEAMAVGLVPFASRTSGSEDVITDGVSGFLFEPRSGPSLSRCLDAVFGSAPTANRKEVAAAAIDRVRKDFSIGVTGLEYAKLYRALMRMSQISAE